MGKRSPQEEGLAARFEQELLSIYLMDILRNAKFHETMDSINMGGGRVATSLVLCKLCLTSLDRNQQSRQLWDME